MWRECAPAFTVAACGSFRSFDRVGKSRPVGGFQASQWLASDVDSTESAKAAQLEASRLPSGSTVNKRAFGSSVGGGAMSHDPSLNTTADPVEALGPPGGPTTTDAEKTGDGRTRGKLAADSISMPPPVSTPATAVQSRIKDTPKTETSMSWPHLLKCSQARTTLKT